MSFSSKRRVTFGHAELDQLDVPAVYKHSSLGYERYKSNPQLYLPDGSLRRKFSLPKLSESIEQFRECRYLRRNSLVDPHITDIEVKNIFNFSKPSTPASESNSDSEVFVDNDSD